MTHYQLATSCLITAALILSTSISASDLGAGLANGSDAVLLENQTGNYKHWNGIGKIFWNDDPACTATLLDTRDTHNLATGPAYLLTAAHCVPGVIRRPLAPNETATVKFNYFTDTAASYLSYGIKDTLWKDFQHTDLAIMELDATLATLLKDGISPLRLASDWAPDATDVLIVGAPGRLAQSGLRLAACTQEATAATLVEGDRVYLSALKNMCKDIRPGSSGSPILDRKSGKILSVISTSTFGATADEQCFDNAPCEVKNGTTTWSPDTHYSFAVDQLQSCFNEGIFANTSSACKFDPVFKVTDLEYWPTQYVAMPKEASSPNPVLNAQFTLSTPLYRYKTVREAMDCRSPRNYSGTLDANKAVLDIPLSRNPGMHYLCVIGVESADTRPTAALMKSAWITPAQLVERTPVRLPEPTLTLGADWNYSVSWRYLVPTHFGTLYYSGAADTDCNKVAIADFVKTFDDVTFRAEQLPLMLCSRNEDLGGRYSKVRSDLLALP